MKPCLTFLLLLFQLNVFAQEAFKPFEVQTPAEPKGGLALLERFIDINRRMPYSAEVAKVKGSVFVTGIVGIDGKMTNVRVARGLQPACDREAVRLLSLFNAWEPAQKDGKPVPMEFTYGVRFAPTRSDCTPEGMTTYYDAEGQQVSDEATAQLRLFIPVDSLGYPTGNPVFTRKKGGSWKTANERFVLSRKDYIRYNYEDPVMPDSSRVQRLSMLNTGNQLQGKVYTFYESGQLYSEESYVDGKAAGTALYFYPNGMVRKAEDQLEQGATREWLWYPNGQLRQVALRSFHPKPSFVLLNLWEETGKQVVKDGNGACQLTGRLGELGWITETGHVAEGLRDSVWAGFTAGGKPFYREAWDNGRFLSGVSYGANGDSLVYNEPEQQPEFQGGQQAMYQFMSQTIRYPVELARSRTGGRVFVSFVVCTDGSLCDYEVLRGAHPVLDEEAVRVVKAMNGKWKPGFRRGRPVRVKYSLPINFAIQ
ncbi:TonB family protein [Tellurirhabdus rosea]|uniref:TonB family protein n=1 Tax=Tellurirhabdus rosea TaxID=2674997 RepID=UPI002252CF7E|nr:TonB family protein [Tellurirhabdus rosea]